ncbi:Lar family restriction alleviation protein [Acetobacter sp. TBRC 12305]|uniref:Lar family restriction alleviation protein n=1 Tax=Acetobacter garciniae TaxID=2817435 RepID=A0A939HP16_9PROT|nr:Lar family restriction alleviation protein [Acetobacter garciniae]MBO1325278.1 Lar family restriction alleviation protein [Acetobacter garciniae]MBX0344750.1 Lar family restriction alleviation protein [Acetobacter garciniae]
MSEELKSYPFCGSNDVVLHEHADWVTCRQCWGEGPYAETKEQGITAWNTRAGEK